MNKRALIDVVQFWMIFLVLIGVAIGIAGLVQHGYGGILVVSMAVIFVLGASFKVYSESLEKYEQELACKHENGQVMPEGYVAWCDNCKEWIGSKK